MITLLEAIKLRHSVRRYTQQPLQQQTIDALLTHIHNINAEQNLNIQLVTNEPRAFKGIFAYGKFSNVSNYLVLAGPKGPALDEKIGYYGEELVLLAQQLGLNTCWAGLSYQKIANTYTLREGDKVVCYIALGYGETQGIDHKRKTPQQVSNISEATPQWFAHGIDSALLAPTAINQQKFSFEYTDANGTPQVIARKGFSLVGYTHIDLGIAKLHFEIAAGKENFTWI